MSKTEAVCSKILVPIALLLALRLSAAIYNHFPHTTTHHKTKFSPQFNYASQEAGAKVLAASGHVTGAKGLLQESNERYLIVPCHYTQEWIEISLTEDICAESIEVFGGEVYSSSFSELVIEGSSAYPTTKWTAMGKFPLAAVRKQYFQLGEPIWLRYLRVTFRTAGVGEHYYCSMNRLAVYGSTIMQDLKEQLAGTQDKSSQKPKDYKSFQGTIAPYGARQNGVEESLILIANMQYIREHGLKLNSYHQGAVLYLNETMNQFPFEHWRMQNNCEKENPKTKRPRGNESVSLFKQVTDQLATTAMKLEAMGDYMSLLEQLSLKTQSKLADLDLNIALVEGQMEGLSKQQMTQGQENSQRSEEVHGEISSLRASLYAMTRELEETKGQLLFVGCFAICNAVFMVLMAACYRPGNGIPLLKSNLWQIEETPRSGGKGDSEKMSFTHVAKDRSRRKKRSQG